MIRQKCETFRLKALGVLAAFLPFVKGAKRAMNWMYSVVAVAFFPSRVGFSSRGRLVSAEFSMNPGPSDWASLDRVPAPSSKQFLMLEHTMGNQTLLEIKDEADSFLRSSFPIRFFKRFANAVKYVRLFQQLSSKGYLPLKLVCERDGRSEVPFSKEKSKPLGTFETGEPRHLCGLFPLSESQRSRVAAAVFLNSTSNHAQSKINAATLVRLYPDLSTESKYPEHHRHTRVGASVMKTTVNVLNPVVSERLVQLANARGLREPRAGLREDVKKATFRKEEEEEEEEEDEQREIMFVCLCSSPGNSSVPPTVLF